MCRPPAGDHPVERKDSANLLWENLACLLFAGGSTVLRRLEYRQSGESLTSRRIGVEARDHRHGV